MPILTTLTGGAASYLWRGLATAMPTGFTNTAPDTVILGYQTDTFSWFAWVDDAWTQLSSPPDIRLTAAYDLEYSLDGGSTWTSVTDWATNFPLAVQHVAPKILMVPGLSYPPIPSMASGGADYVYDPAYN